LSNVKSKNSMSKNLRSNKREDKYVFKEKSEKKRWRWMASRRRPSSTLKLKSFKMKSRSSRRKRSKNSKKPGLRPTSKLTTTP